jgi:hypothetical protein
MEGRPRRLAPSQLSAYAELRNLLTGMEEDLGLNNLNRIERDMYHACNDTIAADGSFTSGELRAHRLMANVPPATFHRALKRLIEVGLVMRHGDSVKKNYVLAVRE